MSLTFWLILAGVIIFVMGISTLVAYFKGKKNGAATAKPNVIQHDAIASDALADKMAEAKKQLEEINVEIQNRRQELETILKMKDEQARLAALAELANKWKVP